jgi:predicted ABC-type ATPase
VFEGRENLLDPDAIARRINPADLRKAAIDAAREAIVRTRSYLREKQSFAIETTLSSSSILETMSQALAAGFVVNLVYVCLDNADWNIERVRARFARGGHDVPDEDVRRRYERSLANLMPAVARANEAWLYDNSGDQPQLVLEARNGSIAWRAADLPAWVIASGLLN